MKIEIQGYGAVFDVPDRSDDIFLYGAFKESIQKHEKNPYIKFLWQHNHSEPVGVLKDIKEDRRGLVITAEIGVDTERSKEVIALVKSGIVDALSIGFFAVKHKYNEQGFREMPLVELWEVSIVTFGAHAQAKITSVRDYASTSANIARRGEEKSMNVALDRAYFAIKSLIIN